MADTLVKETGAIVAGADSYNTLSELEAYFVKYGAPVGWSASLDDVTKCVYARRATRWLDPHWSWRGVLVNLTAPQALAWPRSGVVDEDGRDFESTEIPTAIPRLHAEVTRLAAEDKLQLSELKRGGGVSAQAAGPVSQSFFESAPGGSTYPLLDAIARPLTVPVSNLFFSTGG